MDKTAVLEAINSWPVEEQLELVDAVYDRLAAEGAIVPSPEQWAEIERRMAEHEADPSSALTREEFEARMQGNQ